MLTYLIYTQLNVVNVLIIVIVLLYTNESINNYICLSVCLSERAPYVCHPENVSDVSLFREKKVRFEKARTLPNFGFVQTQKPCLEASCNVACRIAKKKKPHTV